MVHRIKLRLSNAYVVRGERPILVDTGAPGEGRRIAAHLERCGIRLADIALVLHTHIHSDHAGSTLELSQLGVRAPLVCHADDEGLLKQGHNGPLRGVGLLGRIMARFFSYAPFPSFRPDWYAEDGRRLDEFGIAGRLIHTPGHTAGSISLLLDSGEAIVGDVLMGGYLGGCGCGLVQPAELSLLRRGRAADPPELGPNLVRIASYSLCGSRRSPDGGSGSRPLRREVADREGTILVARHLSKGCFEPGPYPCFQRAFRMIDLVYRRDPRETLWP